MENNTSNSLLENKRLGEGNAACKDAFEAVCKKNRIQASRLLNDPQLTFPTLYILFPQIQPRIKYLSLNIRDRKILHILSQMQKDETGNGKIQMLSEKNPNTQSVLKWAVKTGYEFDGDDNYDLIMDTFINILLQSYKDEEILPYAEELIFSRNNQGKNLHDLVFGYFHSHNPNALKRMAKHVRADNRKEASLARELLGMNEICADCQDPDSECDKYISWLEENDPYLFFTEENLLFSNCPRVCKIDQDRKFLQKGFSGYERKKLDKDQLKDEEASQLDAYKRLKSSEKAALCNFSHRFHQSDPKTWEKWMHQPIDEKLDQIKNVMGERS